ncbi:MAG: hypothetical protein AVDCRST_MAG78-78 [uncultured Rubrobacteraceae bacterium]|uniref:Uncharacterized protein n=1 Tax=uncultured Rubrobacteraceae bacterium TaxID=349277 RepID=A0A6J4P3K7_9ACTN|nr:MAG: hypothetical protein AVDCRST_MAG78-78 [uncultured Rubrobacteraceae bacterium]
MRLTRNSILPLYRCLVIEPRSPAFGPSLVLVMLHLVSGYGLLYDPKQTYTGTSETE